MPTKPGYATSEFWAATVTALVGFLNQAFGWNIPPETFASVAAVVAGYAISRGLAKKQATSVVTGSGSARVLPLIAIAALSLSALSLTSCASVTPTVMRGGTALAVSNTLQYGVPKTQRVEVAQNLVAAGSLYTQFSSGTVPTVDQFHLALDTYLPNNPSKAITETNLISLYSANYDLLKSKAPQVQLDYLTAFLQGAADGATPFLPVKP